MGRLHQVTPGIIGGTAVALAGVLLVLAVGAVRTAGQTPPNIVEEWNAVQAPPPPQLRTVTVDPKTTALLILDVISAGCNNERRPRCVRSVPRLSQLLARATTAGMPVIYSLTAGRSVADILLPVRPLGDEPVVTSNSDKFLGTNLEQLLRDRGIRTVIVVGTSAHGAVLHTASAAALRGLQVVVPVDGMSADTLYIEQYTAWHLANAPTIGARVTLTRSDQIRF